MVLGLVAAVVLAHGSVLKAVAMIVLGLLLGLVGTDGNTGGTRFTFGIRELTDGIDVATLAMGVFGVGEIIANLSRPERAALAGRAEDHAAVADRATTSGARGRRCCAAPRSARSSACCRAAARRSSSFAAYALEKKIVARSVALRPGRDRGRGRRRNPPTTPARRPRSSRC